MRNAVNKVREFIKDLLTTKGGSYLLAVILVIAAFALSRVVSLLISLVL